VSVSGRFVSVKVIRNGALQRTMHLPIKVTVTMTDGVLQSARYLPIKATMTGNFAFAKKRLPSKEALEADDIALQRMSVEGSLADIPISDLASFVGMRAKISIPAGQVIRASMVEEIPLVERGDRVTILLQSPSFHISTVGRAEGDGVKGQIIKVVNLSSRKRVHAEVIGEKLVKVTAEGVQR